MPLRSMLFTALATLALTGCEPAPTPDTDPHLQPVTPLATGGNAFQVRVTLSEAAAAALEGATGSVLVQAEYFGYPSISAQQRQLPGTDGASLPLASRQLHLDGAGAVQFPEIVLDAGRLQLVEEGRPHLRVDVRSAEDDGAAADPAAPAAAGDTDLLDCGTYQGPLATAVRDGVDIDCKLTAE